MASDTLPPSGSRLIAERYQLGDLVGEGGMAGVWMAEDSKLHRKVAVKLLTSAMRAKPEVKERFKAEAQAAARLNHPNVVAVYDTGEHEGVPFLVMELLSGRTLADELKKGPMDAARVIRLAGQVLAGLGAAHAAGIVHRDIKPGNILFSSDADSVKVADFGIAKGAEGVDLTQTGTMMGTPAYLSPEQVAGEKATAASDLYSLGVVMYEALAGRQPYEADSMVALANKIHNHEPPSLIEVRPDIDPAIASVVEKAMRKDPSQRFQTAEEMAAGLARVTGRPSRRASDRDDATMVSPAAAAPADQTEVIAGRGTSYDRRTVAPVPEGLSRPVRLAIALAVLAVVLIIGVVAWQSLNQMAPIRPSPSPAAPVIGGSPLPSPLESSLRRLEEAVRP